MLYLFLAEGFEETEAVVPLDMIRRAEIPIQTVGVTGNLVTGAHGITVAADISLADIKTEDLTGVILPGGMPGTLNLQKNEAVIGLLKHCAEHGKLMAAICAAPMVLGDLGLLDGKKAVCFPGFEDHLEGAVLQNCAVMRDGNYITATGAGAALEFGAAIVDYCYPDSEYTSKGKRLLAQMQFPYEL